MPLVVGQAVPAHQQLIEFVIKRAKVPISPLALESRTRLVGLLGGLKEPISKGRDPGRKGIESGSARRSFLDPIDRLGPRLRIGEDAACAVAAYAPGRDGARPWQDRAGTGGFPRVTS